MTITVNGEKIPEKDIEEETDRLREDYDRYVREQNADGGESQLAKWSTENLIERTLIKQAAENSGIKIPSEEIEKAYEEAAESFKGSSPDKAKAEIELQLRMARMIENISETAKVPSLEDVSKYYEENAEQFHAPERISVSHIVKHLDQGQDRTQAFLDISNMKEQINKDKSFEELASIDSDCPDNAGSLGYFARGEMVQEFEDVVFKMKEGEISDVFETPSGYHIAKLNDRTPAGPVPLDAIKDDILERLTEESRQKAVEEFVDGLKKSADIKR